MLIFSLFTSQSDGVLPALSALSGQEPTPFQPMRATSTPQLPTYKISAALVPSGNRETVPGQINILVLGSDWRPNRGMNTDVATLV